MQQRLMALRRHYQMSQREFCERLGIAQSTYAPLESGKRGIRDTYVKLICNAYNVSEAWLRTGEGEMLLKKSDNALEELLYIYDSLTPDLRKCLLGQAKELKALCDTGRH